MDDVKEFRDTSDSDDVEEFWDDPDVWELFWWYPHHADYTWVGDDDTMVAQCGYCAFSADVADHTTNSLRDLLSEHLRIAHYNVVLIS